jgi:hypothetical protein
MRLRPLLFSVLALPVLALACAAPAADDGGASADDAITSNEAQIVDLSFDGEVYAGKDEETRKAIVSQLFYTVGPLTYQLNANGQVGRVETSAVSESIEGDLKHVKYHARLPVAWPKGLKPPRTYAVVLPKDTTKLDAFNAKYDGRCGKNEYGQDTFWHDFNPKAQGCTTDDADVIRTSARVTKDKGETQGKYPEYDKVWADGALNTVAIFGYAEGGGPSDVGQQEYEEFIARAKDAVPGATQTENAKSDSIYRDVTIAGKVGGRDVSVTAILIGTLYTSGPDLAERYNALSESADLVIYNGHSELSKNTNALAHLGKISPKQYQIFFFDSCDTFAYLDTALTDRRIEVNGAADDPKGTKYLDVATNVLPSYFSNYAASSLSLFRALLEKDQPKTYNEILAEIAADQVVVVTGEEDNTYRP